MKKYMNFNTYNIILSLREEKNINRRNIDKALAKWKNGLLEISKIYKKGGDYNTTISSRFYQRYVCL